MGRRIDLFHDFVNAARFLARNRAFSLAAVATLALGIGAATSLFSVADAVLLTKLRVPHPEELVLLHYVIPRGISLGVMTGWNSQTPEGESTSSSLPYPFYEFLRTEREAPGALFAFSGVGGLTLTDRDRSQRVSGELVSGNFFADIGLTAYRGRLIEREDDRPNSQPVLVLSHAFWESNFAADPNIIGRPVTLNRRSYVVIGVAPPEFQGTLQLGTQPAIYVPLSQRQVLHHFGANTDKDDYWWLQVMGRLPAGLSRKRVESALSIAFQNRMRETLARQNPDKDLTALAPPRIALEPGGQGQMDRRRQASSNIDVLAILVALVLLLSCVNLATLLVSKYRARRRELAVKLSLGASRWRLLRELSVEVLLLALVAGVAAVMLSLWSTDLMARLVGRGIPLSVSLNWSVLLFTAGSCLLTGLLVGSFTAFRASGLDPGRALKESDTKVTRSRSSVWVGRSLIGVQVSLAVVLLVATGLFLGTLRNLMKVDVGFDPDQLLVFDIAPETDASTPGQRLALFQQITQDLQLLPSVRQVSYSEQRLIDGSHSSIQFRIGDQPSSSSIDLHYVGPRFLTTMGIPIHAGRDFGQGDGPSRPVAIVSQTLADEYFPGRNPLGQIIQPDLSDSMRSLLPGLDTSFEIVGVGGDTLNARLRDQFKPTIFLPALQNAAFMRQASFVARLAAPPESVIPQIEQIVQKYDRNLPILDLRTYSEQIRESVEQETLFARMSSFFSLVSLVLVAAGIYGTLSHSVASRLREFGIRMALGANRRRIQSLVLHELLSVWIGIACGLVITLGVTRSFSAFFFQLDPANPWMLAAGASLITIVALVTASIPARRASRADPVRVLRSE